MRSHWRVDAEHPDGHLVAFTAAEEKQADRDAQTAADREQAERAERDTVLALLDSPDVTAADLAAVVRSLLVRPAA